VNEGWGIFGGNRQDLWITTYSLLTVEDSLSHTEASKDGEKQRNDAKEGLQRMPREPLALRKKIWLESQKFA